MKRVAKRLLVVLLAISLVETPLGNAGIVLTGEKSVQKVQAAALTEEDLGHQDESGYGTAEHPYTISNKGQLYKLYKLIEDDARNVDTVAFSHCYYRLTEDVVWNEGTASADGSFAGNANPEIWPAIKEFHGSFDGNGHTISGLYLTEESKPNPQGDLQVTGIGLFGNAENAVIKDLAISNSVIKLDGDTVFYNAIGFILGQGQKGTVATVGDVTKISGCSVGSDCFIVADSMAFDPSVTSLTTYVGVNNGINAGEAYSMYRYETTGGLGGLVGMLSGGSIENCSNDSSVVCQNIRLVGGIAGYTEGADIIDCSNTGNIKGSQSVGGITGMANGTLSKVSGCTNTGTVTGLEWTDDFTDAKFPATFSSSVNIMAGDYIGGICGQSASEIIGCTNGSHGQIKGTANVGGIAGHALMEIETSMNYGAVDAFYWTEPWHANIENNFSAILDGDKIFVTGCNAGGIAGSVGEEITTAAGSQGNQIVNCGNVAAVSAEGDGTQANCYVGGILGRKYRIDSSDSEQDIAGCYTAGTVSASHTAFSTQEDITYQNSYYLSETMNTVDAKNLAQFTGGETAYLLNAGWRDLSKPEKAIWQQILSKSGDRDTEPTYPVSNEKTTDYKVIQIQFAVAEGAEPADYSSCTQYINAGGRVDFDSVLPEISGKAYKLTDKDGEAVGVEDTFMEDTVLYVTIVDKPVPPVTTPPAEQTPTAPPAEQTPTAPPAEQTPTAPPAEQTPTAPPAEQTAPAPTTTPPTGQVNPTAPPVNTQDPAKTTTEVEGTQYTIDQEKGYAVFEKPSTSSKVVKIPSTVEVDGKEYPVKKIESKAFYKDKTVKTVVIGNGVEEIGSGTFQGCENLTEVTFPSTVKTIGSNAFSSCDKVKKIELPGGVQKIGSRAFYNCKGLTSLKIKANKGAASTKKFSKGSSGDLSLWQNGLTDKTAVSTSLNIGKEAMAKCVKLQSVVIQNQVRRIGNATFMSCKRLARITVKSMHLQYVGNKALKGVSDCKITVPVVKIKPYKKLFKNKGQGKKVVVSKA